MTDIRDLWLTKAHDLKVVNDIIERHMQFHDGEPADLFGLEIDEKDAVIKVRKSPCLDELIEHFCDEYGRDQGQYIVERVITKYLLEGQTIH